MSKITAPYYEVTAPSAMLKTGKHSWSNRVETKSLFKALWLWIFYKETILSYFYADGEYYKEFLVKRQRK